MVEKTTSWVEFCSKLQKVDEHVKKTETSVYTTRYTNTKEHYRVVQVGAILVWLATG